MGCVVLEIVFQIVDMHVAIAEGLPRREVEVSYNFVDADPALDAAAFLPLCVEVLGVMFALALLDTLATAKRPRNTGISFAHLVTVVAAA